ncbi:hypothetical protein Q3G72_028703 [Acer saccharum]|nr:hypothetical protein Q3G72_028703 [Acer saccharum]
MKVEERGWTGGHPAEQLKEILIRKGDPTKVVKIEGTLDYEVRRNLLALDDQRIDQICMVRWSTSAGQWRITSGKPLGDLHWWACAGRPAHDQRMTSDRPLGYLCWSGA